MIAALTKAKFILSKLRWVGLIAAKAKLSSSLSISQLLSVKNKKKHMRETLQCQEKFGSYFKGAVRNHE